VRRAGLVGVAVGVAAAGAAAGVAIERATVGRGMRRRARLALDAAAPFGTLRGTPGRAAAEDGTELYYEIDEPGAYGDPGGAGSVPGSPLTVVLSHGYCLTQDSWHFQRAALRAAGVRAVYWDQRSHGRSERGRDQAAGAPARIDQLARDLRRVLDAAAPEGPVLLAGHSMGGMTVLAFAAQFPEVVADRVAGVALFDTSAGKLATVTLGLPALGARAVRALAPGVLRLLGSQAELVERGRRATADLYAGIVRRYAFGSEEVDPGVARFAERLIEGTPIDVVAEFYPAFTAHEQTAALAAYAPLPGLVLVGERDLLTPAEHSEEIAARLPLARLVVLPGAGHLAPLERPDEVNAHLTELLAAVREGAP
jgi:pimeloyl-ACP methyl ester carboxylesterase